MPFARGCNLFNLHPLILLRSMICLSNSFLFSLVEMSELFYSEEEFPQRIFCTKEKCNRCFEVGLG